MAIKNLMQIPPHNLDAEKACLGAMLYDRGALDDALGMLSDDDFYHPQHVALCGLLREMSEAGRPVDYVTVKEAAEAAKLKDLGPEEIVALGNCTPSAANVAEYARLVKECATLRKLILLAGEIHARGFDAGTRQDVPGFLSDIGGQVLAVTEQAAQGQASVHVKDVMATLFEELEAAARGERVGNLPTGFTDLDLNYLNGGLPKGAVIVIAARPGVGKTTLATNFAYNLSKNGYAGAVFSLEMRAEELAAKLLSQVSRVPTYKFNASTQKQVLAAAEVLDKLPLRINTTCRNMGHIRGVCRKLRQKGLLDFVVLDYLQLLEHTHTAEMNRQEEVASDSRALKMLARELDCPIIVPTQLNRQLEVANRPPKLSDIRESGAVEQDADIVMLLHRNEGEVETVLNVAKHRNGRTGIVNLVFLAERSEFTQRDHLGIGQPAGGKP